MGFTDAASKLAAKATDLAKSTASMMKAKIEEGKYRKGVMYDFSIVNKAKFYIYVKGESGVFIFDKILPVQINPVMTESENDVETIGYEGMLHETDDQLTENTRIKSVNKSLSLTLPFDVFDEYMASTANDTVAPGILGKCGVGGVSIMDDLSIWQELMSVFRGDPSEKKSSAKRVRFVWGTAYNVFGKVTRADERITCYSRWGTPLKGSINITIEAESDNETEQSEKMASLALKTEIAASSVLLASEAAR